VHNSRFSHRGETKRPGAATGRAAPGQSEDSPDVDQARNNLQMMCRPGGCAGPRLAMVIEGRRVPRPPARMGRASIDANGGPTERERPVD
jgi:hypothetical protein